MTSKIFRSNFITSMLILLMSFCLVFGVLFSYFEKQIFTELESEADYIAYAVKAEGVSYIESFSNEKKRITLVSPDGMVIADTKANAENLENHSDREEIKAAFENGEGTSSRYSSTLMEKNLYYAKKLEDGTVLRISATQSSIFIILLSFL